MLLKEAKTLPALMRLLDDLLTPAEVEKIYERVKIVDCLDQHMSQRKAYAKTGAAIATVSRGAFLLQKDELQLVDTLRSARKTAWWQALFWCA